MPNEWGIGIAQSSVLPQVHQSPQPVLLALDQVIPMGSHSHVLEGPLGGSTVPPSASG